MLHRDINRFFGWPRSNLCSELHNFPFLFGHSTVKRFCPVCRFGPPREAQICSQYDKIWAWRTRGKRNCESSGVAWEVLRADVMRLFSTGVCLHDDNASLLLRPLCAQTRRITDRQLLVMWTILPVIRQADVKVIHPLHLWQNILYRNLWKFRNFFSSTLANRKKTTPVILLKP